MKRQVVHKLGMNGIVDVLDEVLRRAKSETSWEQKQYYEALVIFVIALEIQMAHFQRL